MIVIAAEQFVGRGAGHRHAKALRGDRLRQEVVHVVGNGGDRRVAVARLAGKPVEEVGRAGAHRVQPAADVGDGGADIARLVIALVGVEDREGVHLAPQRLGREGRQRAGIDAAAQAKRHRHVGAQPQLHRARSRSRTPAAISAPVIFCGA